MDGAEAIPRGAFARLLGVHPRTVDRWRRFGLEGLPLPSVRVGGRSRFRLGDYRWWVEQVGKRRLPPAVPGRGTADPGTLAELRRHGIELPGG